MPASTAIAVTTDSVALPVREAFSIDVLERIRSRLGVEAAILHSDHPAGPRLTQSSGRLDLSQRHLTAIAENVVSTGLAFILPDARIEAPRMALGSGVRFLVAIPLPGEAERPAGVLTLVDSRPRTPEAARRLAAIATEALRPPVEPAEDIASLHAELAAQSVTIANQAAELAHSRKIFSRASVAARIGVWECDLPCQTLRWSDVVYDIFEMPRGAPLERSRMVDRYTEASRKQLTLLRDRAIAERGSFTLDAEIITAKGNHRWMRITATVECENDVPVRIFGMKQDITEERLLTEQMRYLAAFDVMTGLANRSQFQERLTATGHPPVSALLLVDLDGFKLVNDTFGHAVGDECLKEVAMRLSTICAGCELVSRLGGDEFAILVGPDHDRTMIDALAAEIVQSLARPIDMGHVAVTIGASVGIAPQMPTQPTELFKQADVALYAAKAAGRNTHRFFDAL